MKYFEYLETKFVDANTAMATGNAEDVTIFGQAKVNASLKLIGLSRSVLMYAYMGYLLVSIVAIKLRLKKAPAFKSSIPPRPPATTKPELVPQPPPTDAA